LARYYAGIGKDNCSKIESVALDEARNYISSGSQYAVSALIAYGRFCAVEKLNRAADMARKQELRKARKDENKESIELMHCRQRFVLLKRKDKLARKQASHLEKYDYKDPARAEEYLRCWIKDALSSSPSVLRKTAEGFLEKRQYIINWFKKKISSAMPEGINNKIKRFKRMAYGHKDIDYFKLKIHQRCGLLNPRRYPH